MSYPLCRHILATGEQCQAPAMRRQPFCYFHGSARERHRAVVGAAAKPAKPSARPSVQTYAPALSRDGAFSMEPVPSRAEAAPEASLPLELGLLEDAAAVQLAISLVVNALARNRLEMRRATALLYGLQLASTNCHAAEEARSNTLLATSTTDLLVREVTLSRGETVAPAGLRGGEVWTHSGEVALATLPDSSQEGT